MILSVEPRSVKQRDVKSGKVEVTAIEGIPTSYSKEYSTQTVSKVDDNKHKITDTIYTVTTYDKAGKLDYYTSLRYLEYLV